MQFVADQMAQVIQSFNRRVTMIDLANAGKLAYLTIFPGNTLIPITAFRYPMGYYTNYLIFYVKGVADNKASVCWGTYFAADGLGASGATNGIYQYKFNSRSNFYEQSRVITQFLTNETPTKIHPNLQIKNGEVKIIAESLIIYSTGRFFGDGTSCSKKSFREVFGFLIFSPKCKEWSGHYSFFNSVTIFTPKPGLFDETPPS